MIYPAGKKAPNYVLHPPRGLALRPGVPHMLGVETAIPLDQLWDRVKTFTRAGKVTRPYRSACAAMEGAKNQMMDVG
jgi:hypothetical protein